MPSWIIKFLWSSAVWLQMDMHTAPQARVVDEVVRILQIDEAQFQWDIARPSQLLQSAHDEHYVGGSIVRAAIRTVLPRESLPLCRKTTELVGQFSRTTSCATRAMYSCHTRPCPIFCVEVSSWRPFVPLSPRQTSKE